MRKFEVRDPTTGLFRGEYVGMDHYDGAEHYAEMCDDYADDQPRLFQSGERTIEVREIGQQEVLRIVIGSYLSTVYTSRDATEGE